MTGGWMLTHVATYEGTYAALNAIKGSGRVADYRVVPRAIFTNPPIAAVGLTEPQAREAGYDVAVGAFRFEWSRRAKATGEARGLIKVVVEAETGKIQGFHILGPHAGDLIHEAAVAYERRRWDAQGHHLDYPHPPRVVQFSNFQTSEVCHSRFYGIVTLIIELTRRRNHVSKLPKS